MIKIWFKFSDFYGLVFIYYSAIQNLLPSHNKTFRSKDNNINSILLTIELIKDQKLISLNESGFNLTFEKPIILYFNFSNVCK